MGVRELKSISIHQDLRVSLSGGRNRYLERLIKLVVVICHEMNLCNYNHYFPQPELFLFIYSNFYITKKKAP